MRFPIKAILIGLLAGAALYFAPFGFPFFFFFIFLFILSRFFFWGRWRRRGWYGYGYGSGCYDGGRYQNDIIPIDGYQKNYGSNDKGPERKINID